MFQLGYHLTAVTAGALVLVYFAGNLGMKACTTAILRRVSFRPLLVVNGLIAAATVAACGWADPHLPRTLLMALLFSAGASRSLQFTALTTLAFADIGPAEKNNAATLSSLLIQGSMAAGVALAAFLLNLVARHAPAPAAPADFRLVFEIMAGLCAAASLGCLRLHAQVGERLRENVVPAGQPR
jgi:MFS family permease